MALYLILPTTQNLDDAIRIDHILSDTHFKHRNIAKLAARPFDNSESTDDMDNTLIERFNSRVRPGDTVLHLGDFAMGLRHESVPLAARLNGDHLLIPGNHDKVSSVFSKAHQEANRELYETYFTVLPETGLFLETSTGGLAAVSHYPFAGSEDHVAGRKFDRLQVVDDGYGLLVHGHTHSPEIGEDRMFHVGVDAHDFYPVAASVVEEWINARFTA